MIGLTGATITIVCIRVGVVAFQLSGGANQLRIC